MSEDPDKKTDPPVPDIFNINKQKEASSNPFMSKPTSSNQTTYLFGAPTTSKADNADIAKSTRQKQPDAVANEKKQEKREQSVAGVKKQQQPAKNKSKQQNSPSNTVQPIREGEKKQTTKDNKQPKRQSNSNADDLMIEDDDQFLGKKEAQSKQNKVVKKDVIIDNAPVSESQNNKQIEQKKEPKQQPQTVKVDPIIDQKPNREDENKQSIKQKIQPQRKSNSDQEDLIMEDEDQILDKKQAQSKQNKSIQQPKPNDSKSQLQAQKSSPKEKQPQPKTKKQEVVKPEIQKEAIVKKQSGSEVVDVKDNHKMKQVDLAMSDEEDILGKSDLSINKKENKQSQNEKQQKQQQDTKNQQTTKKQQTPKLKEKQAEQKSSAAINAPPSTKTVPKLAQDLCMDQEQDILQKQESLPTYVNNRLMKSFHNDVVETIESKNIGPQMFRFAEIQHKYLNQLRILIQLNKIKESQLRAYGFNRDRYRDLINEKTKIFEQNPLPQVITQQALTDELHQKAFSQLQEIQRQLSPLEERFDQTYVRGLYAFPEEMLLITKQDLYEQMLQKEVAQLEKIYQQTEKQTEQIDNILEKKKTLLNVNQVKQAQAAKRDAQLIQAHQEKARKTVFPGSEDESRIIKQSEFTQEYKVIAKNRQEMERKLNELKDDTQVQQLKNAIENLRKQRIQQEELLEKQKQKFEKYSINKKKNLNKEVYMGDVQKMKNHPKIKKLQNELKQLMKEYKQKQEARANRQGSKLSYNSGIRWVSRIEE